MNADSKAFRKRKRFAARLQGTKGLLCSDTPAPNIVICNAGQATGLEKHHIYSIIKQNELDILLPKYVAEKGETFSYLEFETTEYATHFYDKCNGKVKVDNGPVLYMSYVDKVPSLDKIYPNELPEGLSLLNNFISNEEEENFIKLFDWTPEPSNLKNRQVRHYGYEFKYGSNDVDLNNPLDEKIPEECDILWTRLKSNGFDVGKPDQLTVNKYEPGHGIPSHVDKHSPFGSTILSLSLGSDVVMDWKHHSGRYVPLLIQARSLLVMQDQARYDWQHGIQPRLWDPILKHQSTDPTGHVIVVTSDTVPRSIRISLTFRWTRTGPCSCVYKTLCDSAETKLDDIQDEVASNLEDLHVHQVYEQIAGHFSTTRHKPWPRVVQFAQHVPPGSVVLDLGSGNGKNILQRNDIVQVACERSAGLLSECASRISQVSSATDCVRVDVRTAALRESVADAVLCIAVLHHFSTKARRLEAISTIHRVLRSGGRALITVWARDQSTANYLRHSTPATQSSSEIPQTAVCGTLPLPVHENRTNFKHADLLVPWKLRNKNDKTQSEETLLRFYHVFEENELENLCEEVGFVVKENFYEEGNWCVICEK